MWCLSEIVADSTSTANTLSFCVYHQPFLNIVCGFFHEWLWDYQWDGGCRVDQIALVEFIKNINFSSYFSLKEQSLTPTSWKTSLRSEFVRRMLKTRCPPVSCSTNIPFFFYFSCAHLREIFVRAQTSTPIEDQRTELRVICFVLRCTSYGRISIFIIQSPQNGVKFQTR